MLSRFRDLNAKGSVSGADENHSSGLIQRVGYSVYIAEDVTLYVKGLTNIVHPSNV